jgi:hypothetical protein
MAPTRTEGTTQESDLHLEHGANTSSGEPLLGSSEHTQVLASRGPMFASSRLVVGAGLSQSGSSTRRLAVDEYFEQLDQSLSSQPSNSEHASTRQLNFRRLGNAWGSAVSSAGQSSDQMIFEYDVEHHQDGVETNTTYEDNTIPLLFEESSGHSTLRQSFGVRTNHRRRPSGLWENLQCKITRAVAHCLYEPSIHTLTMIQTLLVILQAVPAVADENAPWMSVHAVAHYSLIALFAALTLDAIAQVIVSWRWVVRVDKVRNEVSILDISEVVREWRKHTLYSLRLLARRANAKASLTRSIMESYADVYLSGTRRKQSAYNRRAVIEIGSLNNQPHIWLKVLTTMAFWISIAMEHRTKNLASVFRTISCLRILSLLGISRGTMVLVFHFHPR